MFAKQPELLRAYGALSKGGTAPVSNKQIAEVAGIADSTVALSNSFFVDAGFLIRADSAFLPASEVLEFASAHEWNPDTAPAKLAPLVRRTWFWEAVEPRLRFKPIEEREALQLIAEACSASMDYKRQLQIIVEYLKWTGLVEQDGSVLRAHAGAKAAEREARSETQAPAPSIPENQSRLEQGFAQYNSEAVSIRVNTAMLATWSPARIKGFFDGIALTIIANALDNKVP